MNTFDAPLDFLSVGHLSFDVHRRAGNDLLPAEPGGASAYTALVAKALGLGRVGLAASAGEDYDSSRLAERLSVSLLTGPRSTVFEVDEIAGERRQKLLSRALPVPRELVARATTPGILMVCPLLDELPLDCREWFAPGFSCLLPQGWFRTVGDGGYIEIREPPVRDIRGRWDVIVLSEHEARTCESLAPWRRLCTQLVVTHGERGAQVHGEQVVDIPAVPAVTVVDDTGAGDVWAAAYCVKYVETGDTATAGRYASACAATCIAGQGRGGVPRSPADVEQAYLALSACP